MVELNKNLFSRILFFSKVCSVFLMQWYHKQNLSDEWFTGDSRFSPLVKRFTHECKTYESYYKRIPFGYLPVRTGGMYQYLYTPWYRHMTKELSELTGNNQYSVTKKFHIEDMLILEESLKKQNIMYDILD